jgi:hypothetical protein
MTAEIRQYDFGFAPRPILKLCFVQELIAQRNLIKPPPSRNTLIARIEDGTIEGYFNPDLNCYVVFEDSFKDWIRIRTTAPQLVAA